MLSEAAILAFAPAISRYARRFRGIADPQDLTQGAFEHIWAKRALFTRDDNPEGWMIRVAHNYFVSEARKPRELVGLRHDGAFEDDEGNEALVALRPGEIQAPNQEATVALKEILAYTEKHEDGPALLAWVFEEEHRAGMHPITEKTRRYRLREELKAL